MMAAFAQRGARWLNRPDGRENDNTVDWLDITRGMLTWGSPAAVLDRLVWLREMVGDFGTLVMTANEWHDLEIDKHSMRLLAEKVMPRFS